MTSIVVCCLFVFCLFVCLFVCLSEKDEQYVNTRATTVKSIESTISQISSLYQRFAMHLDAQREQVVRIEANVSDASTSVDAGYEQLLSAMRRAVGERGLILKVFAILLCLAIFFIVYH